MLFLCVVLAMLSTTYRLKPMQKPGAYNKSILQWINAGNFHSKTLNYATHSWGETNILCIVLCVV